MNEECAVCGKELTGTAILVNCSYWGSHRDNCNCVLPVGAGCAKKIPRRFR